MNKAIFIDRDGTINIDTGYIGDENLVQLYTGVATGIKRLKNEYGFYVIVISNQSGISRGLLSIEEVDRVNNKINSILMEEGTSIDSFFYCPYHPDFDSNEKCKCRKPSPQMIYNAAEQFSIDLKDSYFIGDKEIDIRCGFNAGLKTILITNTISEVELNELKNSENSPNFVAANFNDVVKYIETNMNGESVEN